MATKLYVGGLAYAITDDQLRGLFEAFGKVESAQVIIDRSSNQSKGFGFVEMSTDEEAQAAIKELSGKEVSGRSITVNAARPREERSGGYGAAPRRFAGNRTRY